MPYGFIDRLIDEVRARPFLWDSNMESYRDAILKDKAWSEIAMMLGKPKNDVKIEWKKLRDRHRQAMHRKKSKGEQAAAKAKPWIYEKKMEFIQKRWSRTLGDSYIPSRDTNENPEEEQDEEIDDNNMLEVNIMSDDADEVSLASTAINPRELWNSQPTDEDKVLNYLKEKQRRMKINEPDDLDLFFASMCKSTRRLPRFLQSRVKMEVLQVIAKAEECEWNAQQPPEYQRFLSSPSCSSSPQISSAFPDTASLDRREQDQEHS